MPYDFDIIGLVSEDSRIKEKVDPEVKEAFKEIFTGMQGRFTRLKIIKSLSEKPMNTHQLTLKLGKDYKGTQRNLKVLEKNNLIIKVGEKYGAVFYISPYLEANIKALDEVIKQVQKKLNTKKKYY